VFYFALADCDGEFVMGNLSKGSLMVEIEMLNGDSVFSEDERGI